MSTLEMELPRLNEELAAITSKRVRIIWYEMGEKGIKIISDISEWKRIWILTRVKGALSADGIDIVRTRMPRDREDWSLITFENASE